MGRKLKITSFKTILTAKAAEGNKSGHYDRVSHNKTDSTEIAYVFKEQYERVIEDYSKAIQLYPNDALAYINCRVAYFMLDNMGRATSDL